MKLSNWRQLKVRTDLVVSPQTHQGQLYHVVKDPVTLRYFRLRPTEYAIFRMLDGQTPADEIRKRLAEFGHDVSDEELGAFLKQLGAANFYENILPNQAESLYQTAVLRRARRSLWTQVKRILFIRIPLVDPDRAFTRVMRYTRFLWSPWMMLVYGALLALALLAFYNRREEAMANFSGILSPQNLALLWIIFMVEKVFHELGHGLTCKRFGGEVHEMGILVLVMTPCMYCNISDAWILEKPSRKFWISAAGIVAEIIIASIAALVWWATGPGAVNSISYRVMLIAGISSVLVNGNPLMKWDGYYILSDVLGMPNLRENSVRFIGQAFRKYALGMRVPEIARLDREGMIKLVYGVLSTIWIFYVMYRITRGMLANFPALGVWVLVSTLYGLLLVPIVRVSKLVAKKKGQAVDVDLGRLSAIAGLLAIGGYFVFFYDISYSVSAPCVVQPSRRAVVKASSDGILVEMPWRQGDQVKEGDVLAKLANGELENEARLLEAETAAVDAQIDATRSTGPMVKVDNLMKSRTELATRLLQTRRRIESLVVRAPLGGTVITPNPGMQLGRFLLEGDDIVELGDMSTVKVTVAVDEKDMRYVSSRAGASITLRAYPWDTFAGTVGEISRSAMRVLPNAALSSKGGGPVVTRPDIQPHVPLAATYEVSILIPNAQGRLLSGMVGKARVQSGPRRIYDIIYSYALEGLRKFMALVT